MITENPVIRETTYLPDEIVTIGDYSLIDISTLTIYQLDPTPHQYLNTFTQIVSGEKQTIVPTKCIFRGQDHPLRAHAFGCQMRYWLSYNGIGFLFGIFSDENSSNIIICPIE